jgi:hypothetical protein
VIEALGRRGIPIIVLKSLPQVEDLYGSTGGRLTDDVDLLVPAAHARESVELILGLGWHLSESESLMLTALSARTDSGVAAGRRPWHFLPAEGTTRCVIDLHFDVMDLSPKPPLGAGVWQRARPVTRDGVDFLVLSPEDRLLFLCWHFFQHAVVGDFPWEKLRDIELALQVDELDWDYLSERAQTTGLTLFLRLGCDLAASRALQPIAPVWRLRVPLAAPLRYAVLQHIIQRRSGHLNGPGRMMFWLLGHDHPLVMLPAWKELVLPSREHVASYYRGSWPSWPQYALAVVALHAQRVGRLFRGKQ